MGFLSGIFGGGGGSQKISLPPSPSLDPRGKEFQAELYDIITRGLQGAGLTPEITSQSMQDMLEASRKSYLETARDLPGTLARIVPKQDVKVREFIRQSLGRQFATEQEAIRDEFATRKFEDINLAQSLAFDALAGEKRMATSIANLTNQAALRNIGAPTYQTGLMGGLGGALGILLASKLFSQNQNQSGAVNFARLFSSQP